jgi:hypothetical protein
VNPSALSFDVEVFDPPPAVDGQERRVTRRRAHGDRHRIGLRGVILHDDQVHAGRDTRAALCRREHHGLTVATVGTTTEPVASMTGSSTAPEPSGQRRAVHTAAGSPRRRRQFDERGA